MKIVDRFSDFITTEVPRSKRTPISIDSLIKCVSNYKPDDLYDAQKKAPYREIVYMASPVCHYKCIYCYANMKRETELVFLSLHRWKSVLEEGKINGCSNVFFSGGDPFTNPNIYQYINIATQNGYKSTISTRRYLSKLEVNKLRNVGLNILQVSIDAFDKDIVSYLTGIKDGYEHAEQTIINANAENLYIKTKSVITRYNIHQIPQLIDRLFNWGVKEISLNHYSASAGRHSDDLFPSPQMIEMLDEVIREKQNFYKGMVNLQYEFGRAHMMNAKSQTRDLLRKKCNACKDSILINYDGKVYYCEYLMDDERFVIGDLSKSNLMDIWRSNIIKRYAAPDREMFIGSKCFKCNLFETCNPKRCYLRSRIAYGTPFTIDPWCPYSDFKGVIL